jgi:hypothetical protein
MGKIIKNVTRRVQAGVAGMGLINGTETFTMLENGKVLSYQEGRSTGSLLDNEPYIMARVQVEPGLVIRVVIYGEDQCVNIVKTYPARILKPGGGVAGVAPQVMQEHKGEPSFISALLEPLVGGGFGGFGGGATRPVDPQNLNTGGGFRGNDGNGYRLREVVTTVPVESIQAATTAGTGGISRLGAALMAAAGAPAPSGFASRIEVHPPAVAQPAAEREHTQLGDKLKDALAQVANQDENTSLESEQAQQ